MSGEKIMKSIEEQILEILEKIRPFLNQDGGDVSFVKFEDGICYVRLTGACAGCAFADLTMQNMIEELIIGEIPEVIKVENVREA